jgi:hypothetical protein
VLELTKVQKSDTISMVFFRLFNSKSIAEEVKMSRIAGRSAWAKALSFTTAILVCITCTISAREGIIFSEISWGNGEQNPWVELYNPSGTVVELEKASLLVNSDLHDSHYDLSSYALSIEPGEFLVLHFGNRPPEISSGEKGRLKTVKLSAFRDAFPGIQAGFLGITSSTAPGKEWFCDYIAWGGDPLDAAKLYPDSIDPSDVPFVGVWNTPPGTVDMEQGGSIGRLGYLPENHFSWSTYSADESSPGMMNTVPAPVLVTPPPGMATPARDLALGWHSHSSSECYNLQVAMDPDFEILVLDVETDDVRYYPEKEWPAGTLYWRVCAYDRYGTGWSASSRTGRFHILRDEGNPGGSVDLGVEALFQVKDSPMFCLYCPLTGDHNWNSVHPTRGCTHCNTYCARADVRMCASYYGGNVTEDRISYHAYKDNHSYPGQLGHGYGMWPDAALSWALNGAYCYQEWGKPSFSEMKAWIDNAQVISVVENYSAHAVTMDGYTVNGSEYAHRLDPWTGQEAPILYSSWNVTMVDVPEANSVGRDDEKSVWQNPDMDGLSSFCETDRSYTETNFWDTDGGYEDDGMETYYGRDPSDPDDDNTYGLDYTCFITFLGSSPVAPGDEIRCRIDVENLSSSTQNFDAWIDFTLYNGELYRGNPVEGPRTVTLNPSESKRVTLSQRLPMNIPSGGPYAVMVRVGGYPDEIEFCDSFEFDVK